MQTIPRIGLSKLAALRMRERLCHVAWGGVRWFTLAVVVIAVCTFIDWRVDKFRETPMWLRLGLTSLTAFTLAVAAGFWLLLPWLKGPSIIRLARRVEDGIPEFDHRLVTAIQLSEKPGSGGMSAELIEQVARESEAISGRHGFSRFADHRRLKWAAALVGIPLVLIAVLLLAYGTTLFGVLVKRQLLADVEIPRFNQLENLTNSLWPSGDEVTVEYAVSGKIAEDAVGRLRVKPDGLPADEYQLVWVRSHPDGRAVFAVQVPRSSVAFSHRAWVGDGRTRRASEVTFEPRPVVTRTDAWVRLPAFLGVKPDGGAYETYMAQGEITGLANSTARIRVAVQKPLSEATLVLLARTPDGIGEVLKARIPMKLLDEGRSPNDEPEFPAEALADLSPDIVAYRVEVKDVNGFANSTPPKRGVQIAPDAPPVVRLLPERYSEPGVKALDEDIIEGLPVPVGGQVPIAYTARSPQGVGRAQVRYRINERGPWVALTLKPAEATEKSGPFDPVFGTFQNAGFGAQVEFHAARSVDRDMVPDFLSGGGRFDFQTAEVTKITEDGRLTKLEVGDRIEYYIEVFDRNPAVGRPAGRSETRMKEVLTPAEVLSRLDQTRQAESKIRDLEKKQRDVFGKRPD